jgi:hypothetical protein
MAAPATLLSLLMEENSYQASHLFRVGPGATTASITGIGEVRLDYSYSGYDRTAEVPILDYPSESVLEVTIASVLPGACGGRVTNVASWEHLPQLWTSIFDGYGRPKLIFGHPSTLMALVLGLQTIDPNRNFLSPAPMGTNAHASFLGAELFPVPGMAEKVIVLVQDGSEVGRVYWRERTRERQPVYGSSYGVPIGMSVGAQRLRAGIVLNTSAMACVQITPAPPPSPRTAWVRVLEEEHWGD